LKSPNGENAVILLDENYKERYEGFDPNSPESHILFELTQSAYQESSLSLASKIEHQFSKRVSRRSLGVKQGPFWVLWRTGHAQCVSGGRIPLEFKGRTVPIQ
jgi:N-acetylmuramoyl-L-alanine amidase